MRLFRKRKSLAPGQGDATARDISESASLPSASGAGASLQAEEQATLADTAGASERLDGVSKSDVVPHGKGGHATSSNDVLLPWAATTEAEPVSSIQGRVENEAATQQPIGRRNSQSKKDRFRLFRSRSSQFRKGTDDGSSKGGAGGSVTTTHSHRSRLSWPAPRSTTTGPAPAPEPPARAQRQSSPTGRPRFETVEEGVSAAYAASPQPRLQATSRAAGPESPPPPPPLRKEQKRPNSVIGATTSSVDTSSSSSWRLQSLKRLPSLSLKRRLSRSHKLKPPQVIVTPATVVSFFFFFLICFSLSSCLGLMELSEKKPNLRWVGRRNEDEGGTLGCVFAERHSPVHQISPHILPQIHQPICETGYGRHCHSMPPLAAIRPWPFSSRRPDSPLPDDQLEV